ncbi:Hypothetical predicted protein, partial [Prunus dulcis]
MALRLLQEVPQQHGASMNFYTFLNSWEQEKQCYQFSTMLIHLMHENKLGVLLRMIKTKVQEWRSALAKMADFS